MDAGNVALLRAQVAVMNLFRAQGQLRAQGSLDLSQMTQLWPEYGLRDRDLRGAVATLSGRGLLRLAPHEVGERIVITEAGARWSQSLPAWLEYRLLAPRRNLHQAACAANRPAPLEPRPERRIARAAVIASEPRIHAAAA